MDVIPLQKPPSKAEAQAIIRQMANEGRLLMHPHRRKRASISNLQVINCLKKGMVQEDPVQNLTHKGWETAVVGKAGGDYLRVVVVLRWKQDLLVITAYYH